jgi:cytochrome c553
VATIALSLSFATQAAPPDAFPSWAFPSCLQRPAAQDGDAVPLHVPGSSQQFSKQDIRNWSVTRDWFPEEHAALPPVLARGLSPEKIACGYCHLPDGAGRPENAKLAGLPAAYIVTEVKAMLGGQRQAAQTDYVPARLMRDAVADLSDEDIAAAAKYFSRQAAKSLLRVVEQDRVPRHEVACFIYRRAGKGTVPLGPSILEMPDDMDMFEARNPHTTYIAYVPRGSVERGRVLAESSARNPPCATCHGAHLAGDVRLPGPPLAGRFATYLFRQLYAFQTGARGDQAAASMRPIVAQLTQADMIDLAAYAASLRPLLH